MSIPRNGKTTYSITSTIKPASSTLCAQQAQNWRRGELTRDPHLNRAVGDAMRWAETCDGEEGVQPLWMVKIWWLNTQYYRRTVVLFVKHTSTLFSFHCWSSLLEIHIISNYKGLLQTDEISDKEQKKKKSQKFSLAFGKPYTNSFD